MIFTSFSFLVFFVIVFFLYHLIGQTRIQNILVFVASCFFYGWWSWKYLFLMLGLSFLGYICALLMESRSTSQKKIILWCVLVIALGSLVFFKYFSFIYETFAVLAHLIGATSTPLRLEFEIVLPIAISFHTFQLIAYVVDVYRGEQIPERSLLDFMVFSFFFPQLIAGPIERASALLTQFKHPRVLTRQGLEKGLLLASYGYFVKLALADNAANIVNSIFVNNQVSGWSVVFAVILFGFQIYFDFMGYSLIAKAIGQLLGFDLIWNFNLPYWAVSPSGFWKRWHISLSRWLRDYLYIPLGGNRLSQAATMLNLFITMSLGGLWHGASWNFVLWGMWHGLVLIFHRIVAKGKAPESTVGDVLGWFFTMTCVFIGWYLFRVPWGGVGYATIRSFSNWELFPAHHYQLRAVLFFTLLLFVLEYPQRLSTNRLVFLQYGSLTRGVLCGLFSFLAYCFHSKVEYSFIYFAF